MEGRWIYLGIPFLFMAVSVYNLYDEILIRWLHKRGRASTARVEAVVRSFPKDNARLFVLPNQHDETETYMARCDYILTLAVRLPDGTEKPARNVIVPARIKRNGGLHYPSYQAGDEVPVRYHPKHPAQVVVTNDEVVRRQTKTFPLIVWTSCTLLLTMVLVAMILTK